MLQRREPLYKGLNLVITRTQSEMKHMVALRH